MASSSASAESVGSSTLSVRVKDVIAIRILDDTGTSSISTLGIDIAPTPNGSTVTKNAIVDVATSNETGYTLYMDSDYKEDGTSSSTTPETQFNYTTDLIHTDPTVTVTIPSSVPSSSSDTNFWNYTTSWNDTIGTGSNTTTLTGSTPATVIPTHGTPDTIRDDVTEPSDSSMTTIGINVNVDNDIPSGTYKNKLVFTAVANELPPALPDFWTIATMQEMTPEVCASVYTPNNTVSMTDEYIIDKSRALAGDYTVTSDNSSPLVPEVTLLDDRDADGTGTKKSYKVRKLADGNCWMVDNLEYDLVGLYNNGKRGIGSKNDGSTFEMTDANLATGVGGYYTTTTNQANYVLNSNTKSLTNITKNSYLGNTTSQAEYYYNWTAATAGQGSMSNTTEGVSIDGSICPAGWRLPTNYTDITNRNISWGALTDTYLGITVSTDTATGYQTLEQYPINLYRAGAVYSGSQDYTTRGYYWSSTINNANRGYSMAYFTSSIWPQNYNLKSFGSQIRCVAPAKKTFWTINTMQEMTPDICATATLPSTSATVADTDGSHDGDSSYVPQRTIIDARDNNDYTIRRLADGNCWMIVNLRFRLTSGQTLTSDTTDLNSRSSWTPSATTQNGTNAVWDSNVTEHSYIDSTVLTDGDGASQYVGAKYNWYTATAMSGNQSTGSSGSEVAPDSICPKGWKLPPSSSTYPHSYSGLFNTYGLSGSTLMTATGKFPFSYIFSGWYQPDQGRPNGMTNNFTEVWSSEALSSTYAYYFGRNNSVNTASPAADDTPKSYGFVVRCVNR